MVQQFETEFGGILLVVFHIHIITMDGVLLVVVSKIKHRTYENLNIFTIKTEIIKMSRDKMSRMAKVTKFEHIYVYQ